MGRLMLNVLLSLRPVRAGDHQRADAGQDRGGPAEGEVGRRHAGPRATTSSPAAGKLVVNADEAERVREIFELYLRARVAAAGGAGTGRAAGGRTSGGRRRRATSAAGGRSQARSLYQLLTNVAVRRARCGTRTRSTPASTRRSSTPQRLAEGAGRAAAATAAPAGATVRNRYGACSRGCSDCGPCGVRDDAVAHDQGRQASATATTSARPAQKRGWHTCPTKASRRARSSGSWSSRSGRSAATRRCCARCCAQAEVQARRRQSAMEAERTVPARGPAGVARRIARPCRADCSRGGTTPGARAGWPTCRSGSPRARPGAGG